MFAKEIAEPSQQCYAGTGSEVAPKMIRNVIMLKFRPGTTPEQIAAMTSAMDALHFDGLVNRSFGMDLGLREGNMSAVFIADFVDEDAYRAYDRDEDHNRIRRELTAPIVEYVERCQYRI